MHLCPSDATIFAQQQRQQQQQQLSRLSLPLVHSHSVIHSATVPSLGLCNIRPSVRSLAHSFIHSSDVSVILTKFKARPAAAAARATQLTWNRKLLPLVAGAPMCTLNAVFLSEFEFYLSRPARHSFCCGPLSVRRPTIGKPTNTFDGYSLTHSLTRSLTHWPTDWCWSYVVAPISHEYKRLSSGVGLPCFMHIHLRAP